MAYSRLREQALALRTKGNSIRDIAISLRVSKSTVSYWCRNISLSPEQIRLLEKRQSRGGARGRLRAAEIKRAARVRAVQEEAARGAQSVGSVTSRDLFILGAALYWGEGYKSGNEECGLTNSNPDIIRAYLCWLHDVYNVQRSDLIARVSVNKSHENRAREIEKYWARATGIPLRQFTKMSLIKTASKKIYKNRDDHFGTIRVKVRRGTVLRRRILGSIAEISRQIHSMSLRTPNMSS